MREIGWDNIVVGLLFCPLEYRRAHLETVDHNFRYLFKSLYSIAIDIASIKSGQNIGIEVDSL